MKLRDIVIKAVKDRDAEAATVLVDFLRFNQGFNYENTYRFVNSIAPIGRSEWDNLLYAADMLH